MKYGLCSRSSATFAPSREDFIGFSYQISRQCVNLKAVPKFVMKKYSTFLKASLAFAILAGMSLPAEAGRRRSSSTTPPPAVIDTSVKVPVISPL